MARKSKFGVKDLLPASAANTDAQHTARVKLLVSIVNHGDEKKLKEILDDVSVALSYRFAGTGTAHSSVLDYLGIEDAEKAVMLSLFPEPDEEQLMREIRDKMSLYLVGRGISFTIPLTGISQIVANGLTGAAVNKNPNGSKIMKSADRKYNLIVASVAANFVDSAMDAARSAGAAGGTIIRARAMKNAKAEQFIGISLVQEQELLLILARKEKTDEILNALSDKVGAKTQAAGVIFALPVDKTAGISVTEEEEPQSDKGE